MFFFLFVAKLPNVSQVCLKYFVFNLNFFIKILLLIYGGNSNLQFVFKTLAINVYSFADFSFFIFFYYNNEKYYCTSGLRHFKQGRSSKRVLLWSQCRDLSRTKKLILYKTPILPELRYGAVAWKLLSTDTTALRVCGRKDFRIQYKCD